MQQLWRNSWAEVDKIGKAENYSSRHLYINPTLLRLPVSHASGVLTQMRDETEMHKTTQPPRPPGLTGNIVPLVPSLGSSGPAAQMKTLKRGLAYGNHRFQGLCGKAMCQSYWLNAPGTDGWCIETRTRQWKRNAKRGVELRVSDRNFRA